MLRNLNQQHFWATRRLAHLFKNGSVARLSFQVHTVSGTCNEHRFEWRSCQGPRALGRMKPFCTFFESISGWLARNSNAEVSSATGPAEDRHPSPPAKENNPPKRNLQRVVEEQLLDGETAPSGLGPTFLLDRSKGQLNPDQRYFSGTILAGSVRHWFHVVRLLLGTCSAKGSLRRMTACRGA